MVSKIFATPTITVSASDTIVSPNHSVTLRAELSSGDFSDSSIIQWMYQDVITGWQNVENANSPTLEITNTSFSGTTQKYRAVVMELRPGFPAYTGCWVISSPVLITKCTVLPIKISGFAGSVENGVAKFTFTVEDVYKLYIESSKTSNFVSVISVEVSSFNSYTDPTISGERYYRLKAVSPTGSVVYSKVIFLKKDQKIDFSKKFNFAVYTTGGQLVEKLELQNYTYSSFEELSKSVLVNLKPNTLYYISLTQGDNREVKSYFKQ